MASAKPTRAEGKAATREGLKAAARACFVERGYEATAVGDIARAAGVAHGTVYVHFAGKQALLDELMADLEGEMVRRLHPVLARVGAGDRQRAVRRAAEVILDHLWQERDFIECCAPRIAAALGVTALRDGINPPVAALLGAALARLSGAAGGRARARWELATHGLLALWLRVALQYLFNPAVTRATAVDTLVRMTTGALDGLEEESAP